MSLRPPSFNNTKTYYWTHGIDGGNYALSDGEDQVSDMFYNPGKTNQERNTHDSSKSTHVIRFNQVNQSIMQ